MIPTILCASFFGLCVSLSKFSSQGSNVMPLIGILKLYVELRPSGKVTIIFCLFHYL